jgi:23S rRNA (cytosine1962-C5)-methyltransferase
VTRHDEPVDDGFLRRRLHAAWAFRGTLGYDGDAARVVFGEGDHLPGLVVDRYGDVLVLQALTRGIAARAGRLAQLAAEVTGTRAVYRRGDPTAAAIEGFDDLSGWLVGQAESVIEIREGRAHSRLDRRGGQGPASTSTRENRAQITGAGGRLAVRTPSPTGRLRRLGAPARRVRARARQPGAAARGPRRIWPRTRRPAAARHEVLEARLLTRSAPSSETAAASMVVLRPPPFTRRRRRSTALRGYKEINLRARSAASGRGSATFSCSHHVSPASSRRSAGRAARTPGARRVAARAARPDHPVPRGA